MLIRALYRLSCTPNPRSQGLSLNLELTNAARLADQTSIRDPSNSLPHLQSYDYSSFCCEESQFHQEAASEKISKVELSLAPPRSADRDHVPQYAALWDHSSSHDGFQERHTGPRDKKVTEIPSRPLGNPTHATTSYLLLQCPGQSRVPGASCGL
ncbi:hypothetical protein LEMLEM_LOCUS23585 [Lemmus lemmus]